jgi:hypothetical protein
MTVKKGGSVKNKIKGGNLPYYPVATHSKIPKYTSIKFLSNPLQFIHVNIMHLNNSKFFAGVIMILLNIGSKFISVNFSKSTEEYLKYTLSKQILVFSMAWMATRDIYTALVLTAVFVILSEHLFNEDSYFCVVPQSCRVVHKLKAAAHPDNNIVTEEELSNAIQILEKAKKEKQEQIHKDANEKFKNL